MRPSWARGLFAASAGVLAGVLLARATTLVARFDCVAFDGQARILRALHQTYVGREPGRDVESRIAVIGIDADSLRSLGVPLAMLHEALGEALEAVAAGHPRAIGLDLSLPEHSFDRFAPGLDRSLMRGLLAARNTGPLVIALDIDGQGRPTPPYLPLLAVAGGDPAFGLAVFPRDCDGTVRRYVPDPKQKLFGKTILEPSSCDGWLAAGVADEAMVGSLPTAVPTSFAGRVAAHAGLGSGLTQAGWIDFTRARAFDVMPLLEVLKWARNPQLRGNGRFENRIVLFGSLLPDVDRTPIPVRLLSSEPSSAAPPGVILNALVLQNALDDGLLRAPPAIVRVAVLALAAGIAFFSRQSLRWGVAAAAALALFGAGIVGHVTGWFLAPGQALATIACAVVVRSVLDLAAARAAREHVERVFGAYLGPQVRDLLLRTTAQPQPLRRAAALLFADLRGFTQWSEHSEAQLVHDTLNRYFEAITPVVHRHGGTVDNFRGDGVMAVFGAPEPRNRPCDDAWAAASEILLAIAALNERDLVPRGISPLQASLGMDFGEVVIGEVGSAERKDFTALGDAVNVAARLQELAKQTGYAVCVTARFAAQLSPDVRGGMGSLGVRELKGHSPIEVYGWNSRPEASA